MSISTELTRIKNAKSALKTAINAKGGTLTNEKLEAYAAAVGALSGETEFDYQINAGSEFSVSYDGSSPDIVRITPTGALTYCDDGGVLVFTGVTEGKAHIVIADDLGEGEESIISEYDVNVIPAYEMSLQSKTASSNGVVTADEEYDGLEKVTVNVTPYLQNKTATPSESAQTISADGLYDGLSSVTVAAIATETKSVSPAASAQEVTPASGKYLKKVTVGAVATETKSVTQNGTYTPTSGKFFSSVTVNVAATGYDRVVTVGDTVNVDDLPYDEAYTISSSNTGAVTAADDGGVWLVEAVGAGEATVTVTETTADGDVAKGRLRILVNAKQVAGSPIEVATAAEMNALLVEKNVGKIYKFTGTSDGTYVNGDIYEVVATS
ncbi:MAG: hypothetical protein MR471_01640 [Clostridia bacterium]|nr:hypothetical protein [Clostridia bacterium]MDY3784485.1 hypothetical protein [Eubacteriales bacterium]